MCLSAAMHCYLLKCGIVGDSAGEGIDASLWEAVELCLLTYVTLYSYLNNCNQSLTHRYLADDTIEYK